MNTHCYCFSQLFQVKLFQPIREIQFRAKLNVLFEPRNRRVWNRDFHLTRVILPVRFHDCIILQSSKRTMSVNNNTKRSHTQLDSRKQVIAFQDRVMTINIKEAQHPLKWEKQVIDKSSIMLKISTKSMHRVLVWEIGPANNTTRCSRLSKRRLLHAWHPSQLAINLSIDKFKSQIHVNNKSD